MSIKSIDNPTLSNSEGISKKINKGAEKMVFDILQATQYSTPIPSTVRELVSNACDAQREKEIALEILSGEKKVSDYYIERSGDQYEDSNFNPEYYDVDSLDKENNDVIITYHQKEGMGYCDIFEVLDYGVGIGERRLEGILELGYSTKRNTSENFGAFGLGAKVALSTGVDFYTIETVHNGKRFKCNCYPYKTDFLIPKFNPYIEFSDGTKVHYEETDSKNYTKISFGVKKHNRNKFEESISDQLNYLPNVRFYVKYTDGVEVERHFKSEVLHNSDSIIVAKSYGYVKPHVVVVKSKDSSVGINYGYIDFRELEMEQLYGSVGLKCPIRQAYTTEEGEEIVVQDGIEVTPSREKVIWSEHTKNYIQRVINEAAEEASRMVEESLKETDLISWVRACNNVTSKSGGGSDALSQISKIIDTSDIKPRFLSDNRIAFKGIESFFAGYNVRKVFYTADYKDKDKKSLGKELKISTNPITSWKDFYGEVYYSKDFLSKVKSYTIASKAEEKTFILITPKKVNDENELSLSDEVIRNHRKIKDNIGLLDKHIKESSLVKSYDDFEVTEEDQEAYEKAKSVYAKMEVSESVLSPEERRALKNSIVVHGMRMDKAGYNYQVILDKIEPTLQQIKDSKFTFVYGRHDDTDKLKFGYLLYYKEYPKLSDIVNLRDSFYYENPQDWERAGFFDDIPVKYSKTLTKLDPEDHDQMTETYKHLPVFIKVSGKVERKIKDFDNVVHVDQFMSSWDSKSKTIKVDRNLKKYFTAKLITPPPTWLGALDFISPKYKEIDRKLSSYVYHAHDSILRSASDNIGEYLKFFQKCVELKQYMLSVEDQEDSKELIAKKSRELLIFSDIEDADIYDVDDVQLSKEVEEFALEIDSLLSRVSFVTYPVNKDTDQFHKEVIHYLKSKGKLEMEFTLPEPSKS